MTLDDIARRLDLLEAKQAIADLIHAGARANDRKDLDGMRACYWPDAITWHGGYKGPSAGFIDYAVPIIERCLQAAHHVSNVLVEVQGDRALAESHYFAHHRRPAASGAGEEDAFFEGRYIDVLERREGEWRIVLRRGISDFSGAVPATTPYAAWPQGTHSLPRPDDEFYRIARAFRAGEPLV